MMIIKREPLEQLNKILIGMSWSFLIWYDSGSVVVVSKTPDDTITYKTPLVYNNGLKAWETK